MKGSAYPYAGLVSFGPTLRCPTLVIVCFVRVCKGATSSSNAWIYRPNLSVVRRNNHDVPDGLGGNFQADKQTSERKGCRDGRQS